MSVCFFARRGSDVKWDTGKRLGATAIALIFSAIQTRLHYSAKPIKSVWAKKPVCLHTLAANQFLRFSSVTL